MTTIENELSVAKRFHALVSIYERRPAMARRNILPILIRFTRSTDRELRYIAVDCILLLSQHPQCSAALLKYPVLQRSLNELLKDTEMDDPELHNLVSFVLQQLSSPSMAENASRLSSLSSAVDSVSPSVSSVEPSPLNPTSFASDERVEGERREALSSNGWNYLSPPEEMRQWGAGGVVVSNGVGPLPHEGDARAGGSGGAVLVEGGVGPGGVGSPASIAGAGPLGAAVSRRLPPPIHALQQQAQHHPKPRGQEDYDNEEDVLPQRIAASMECATSLTRVGGVFPPMESSSLFYQNINRDGVGLDSPHMVTFYVPHLYPRTNTATLEHLLQTIKGVISYHLYPTDHQIRVYMICKPQLVQQALEQQAMLRSTILQDELLLLDSARAPSMSQATRSSHRWVHWGRGMAIATKLVAKADRLRGKHQKEEDMGVMTDASPCSSFTPAGSTLPSSSSGFRLFFDPTETRRASWFHLTRIFFLEMFKTFKVYNSPSKSTIEARVAWQRDCLALEQEIDNVGGAATRHGEWWGKALSRLW